VSVDKGWGPDDAILEGVPFLYDFLKDQGRSSEQLKIFALPGDGSKRRFWRILPGDSGKSLIFMENIPSDDFSRRENLAYLKIGKHLREKGLPVPEIHRFDFERGWFLMEDMGDVSLQEWSLNNRNRVPLYRSLVEMLFRLQTEGIEGFDPSWTCQTQRYDRNVMRRYESDYFRHAFLENYLGRRLDWSSLEASFEHLAARAAQAPSRFFLHRDFQSRNIMLSEGRIGILDWQGGRIGPLGYDLASLLIDPYVSLSEEEREAVFRHYLGLLEAELPEQVEIFISSYPYLAVQRNLQILGAFSFLSRVRGKTRFKSYIVPALHSLYRLTAELRDPELHDLRMLSESLAQTFSAQ